MRILLRKLDDTLIPEYIEITPKTLKKKINLDDVVILLDDVDELKYLDYF